MITTIKDWKIFLRINENITNSFINDGNYTVGLHGMRCDNHVDDINTSLGDEDFEYDYPYYIPEGSIVHISKYNSLLVKIIITKLGNGNIPFYIDKVEEGKTYYSTEETAFGSKNIVYNL